MREILFRGLTFDTKEWVEGSLYLPKLEKESGFAWILGELEERTLVLLETVGQFTGLLDKNGKKVFEGDLVTIYDAYNACTAKGVAEIRFSYEYVGGWVASSDGKDALNIGTRMNLVEVVGNVWDAKITELETYLKSVITTGEPPCSN